MYVKERCEGRMSRDIAAYAGYVEDEAMLLSCSSGGIATALACAMIQRGGYVAGVAYADDFKSARYIVTNRLEDIERLKGSKYVEADKGTVYAEVQALLDRGESVLFFGLPCVVAALRTYLKKDYEQLVAVELICHGPTVQKVHRDYIEHLEKTYGGRVVDFTVRRKQGAWLPSYLYAAFDNGREMSKPFYHTEYGYGFVMMAKKACYSCRFRGENRTGDLMLGDFRGAREQDAFWHPYGVSAILVGSERGQALLHATKGIRLFETTYERIVQNNLNIIQPREMQPRSEKFQQLIVDHDLFYAAQHSKHWTTRLKAWLKKHLAK